MLFSLSWDKELGAGLMIQGIGIDSIEIERIKKACTRESFIFRVFTEKERKYCLNKKESASSFAARFAAKEAVAKALGVGLGKISWQEIEIENSNDKKPGVILHGQAKNRFIEIQAKYVHISLSHDKERALAMVIIEGGE